MRNQNKIFGKVSFKGASFESRSARLVASIRLNGKAKHLGTFDTPEEAARAYDKAALQMRHMIALRTPLYPRRLRHVEAVTMAKKPAETEKAPATVATTALQSAPAPAVLHADFAKRLLRACDKSTVVPPQQYGRLTWFQREFSRRFEVSISVESVRKWFGGLSMPRKETMVQLAQILEVDAAWLQLGSEPELRDKKIRHATLNGAVNVVAGFLQMDGGMPAFPTDNDARAERDFIDLYAIIKGAQYAFHVSVAQAGPDGQQRFTVPSNFEGAFQIGVIREGMSVRMVELQHELLTERGERRSGQVEVVLEPRDIDAAEITSFSKRL